MRRSFTEQQLADSQPAAEDFIAMLGFFEGHPELIHHFSETDQLPNSYIKINEKIYYISSLALGEGSYSKAWLAYDIDGNRYALKFSRFTNSHLEAEQTIESDLGFFEGVLEKERVNEFGCLEKEYFRLMPYLGKNLINYLEPKKLSRDQVFDIIWQALHQVSRFHNGELSKKNQPYLHRDIKPGNFVWNTQNQELVLIDFGFAIRIPHNANIYLDNQKMGTRYYMAPEIKKHALYSRESDIYALGLTILEILELSGIEAPEIKKIAELMSASAPALRPNLQWVQRSLFVFMNRKNLDISSLKEAIILFNANAENEFSEKENFNSLMKNENLTYLLDEISQDSVFLSLAFSSLSSIEKINQLATIFRNTELDYHQKYVALLIPSYLNFLVFSQTQGFDAREVLNDLAWNGEIDLIKQVLQHHQPRFEVNELTPLEIAIRKKNNELVEYLLSPSNPTKQNLLASHYFTSGSALRFALEHQQWNIALSLILAGSAYRTGQLHQLANNLVMQSSLTLITKLRASFPDLLRQRLPDLSLIMLAAHNENCEVLTYLIQNAKPEILNMTSASEGKTALNFAFSKKNWQAAKILLLAGANPNQLERENCSFLKYAIANKLWELAAILLLSGADLYSKNLTKESNDETISLIKKHRTHLVHALTDSLRSEEIFNNGEAKERALNFLYQLGVTPESDANSATHKIFFNHSSCCGLFGASSDATLRHLAEQYTPSLPSLAS